MSLYAVKLPDNELGRDQYLSTRFERDFPEYAAPFKTREAAESLIPFSEPGSTVVEHPADWDCIEESDLIG